MSACNSGVVYFYIAPFEGAEVSPGEIIYQRHSTPVV